MIKMKKEEVLRLANDLVSQRSGTSDKVEEAESLLLSYLNDNSDDTEMWYRLAILDLMPPLVDFDASISHLRRLWENLGEAKAVIYIANIQCIHCAITDDIFKTLQQCQAEDAKMEAMRFYSLGLYYMQENEEENAVFSFLKAVELYPNFVRAHDYLGGIYKKKDAYLSNLHYTKAVENVQFISTMEFIQEKTDWFSVEGFENESILGISITETLYEYFKSHVSLP